MQPFQSFATGVLADVVRRQPASPARTTFVWTVAAGPAMARAATVEARNGILFITPKDARWSREIARSCDVILRRVQQLLGPGAVASITICDRQ